MDSRDYNLAVKQYADGLYFFVIGQGVVQQAAEDIVQDCFEVLWKKKRSVDASKCKSFLFAIAYNKSMDYYRKKYKQRDPIPTSVYAETDTNFDTKKYIMQAMLKLKPKQRTAILLKDWEGYSYSEIADIMQVSLDQVKVNIHRGRKQLKQELQFLKK